MCLKGPYLWFVGMGYLNDGVSVGVLKIAHFEFYRMQILMGGGSERVLIDSIFEYLAWGFRWVGGPK